MEIVDKDVFRWFDEQTDIELVRKIAEGGMGTVYEGIRHGTDNFEKRVAVKVIRPGFTDDEDFVDMFMGEAKLVADLVHINIVQIYNLGKIGDLYYISMEYVHGIDLDDFIWKHVEESCVIPRELATFIVTRVAKALEYAHEKRDRQGRRLNVVHRDICPKNIMISSEGVVKLTDFGIAKAQNLRKDMEGELLMGKAPYMSPEQAQFEETDHRSDIFSLGTVFHELLTEKQLFGAPKTDVILDNVVKQEIPPPREENPDVPEELNRIVTRMLSREPGDRYESAGRLAHDLERYMYEPGFGPTYDKLRDYLSGLFPEIFSIESKSAPDPSLEETGSL